MVERNDTFATVFDEAEKIIDTPGTSLKGIGETPCSGWLLWSTLHSMMLLVKAADQSLARKDHFLCRFLGACC
jgi:hypothetical protein